MHEISQGFDMVATCLATTQPSRRSFENFSHAISTNEFVDIQRSHNESGLRCADDRSLLVHGLQAFSPDALRNVMLLRRQDLSLRIARSQTVVQNARLTGSDNLLSPRKSAALTCRPWNLFIIKVAHSSHYRQRSIIFSLVWFDEQIH